MSNLHAIFGNLITHQVMRAGEALPPARPGISWLWGANGIFKRGVDAHRDLMILFAGTPPTPGLAKLQPHVRFRGVPERIPTAILDQVLLHAKCLGRCEQQYFITYQEYTFQVLQPPQEATAGNVTYALPVDAVPLVDLHSHHHMYAFFSGTDDRDDTGLSVSGVVGMLHTNAPQIILRANVYGHRQHIPLESIFTGAGLFFDQGDYATHQH